jgi:mono/diheme cytochrome c family protein
VVLGSSGCGAVKRVTEGDPAHGKELFLTPASASDPSCASCHTLADAGSTGTVGPNLDDAFASVKAQGFSKQTITDVVRGQIAYAEPPMPQNLYEGQDADDISVYIALCSANPHCGVTAEKPASATTTTSSTTTTTGSAAPDGKAVFMSAGCGGCHTLKDAGTSGTVGPNLDQLKPSESTVEHQVETGGGAMPSFKGRLTPAEIAAVAKYVSSVAGK